MIPTCDWLHRVLMGDSDILGSKKVCSGDGWLYVDFIIGQSYPVPFGQSFVGPKEILSAYGARSRGQCLGIVVMLDQKGEASRRHLRVNGVWAKSSYSDFTLA